MHDQAFDALQANAQALRQTASDFEKLFLSLKDKEGRRFDAGTPHPQAQLSVADLLTGIRGLLEMISGSEFERSILVPKSFVENLSTKISELRNHINGLVEQLNTFPAQHGGIQAIDPSAVTILMTDGNSLSPAKFFNRIVAGLDPRNLDRLRRRRRRHIGWTWIFVPVVQKSGQSQSQKSTDRDCPGNRIRLSGFHSRAPSVGAAADCHRT